MEQKKILEGFIDTLENKKGRFLFFVIDSKGKPMASVAYAYSQAKQLIDLGYSASILVDSTTTYHGAPWLGEEYNDIPVINIKQEKFNVRATDFIFIPELFSQVMESIKNFPSKKIVMLQNYEYALEALDFGKRWSDFNFNDVLVTNENMSNFIVSLFPTINTHIVPFAIEDKFKDKDLLRKPTILIGSRDVAKATRFVKSFYLQFPHLQWFSFKMVADMSQADLANELSESCALVWMDETASFGTLPLEAMATKTPVIGVLPNMIPEWMVEPATENSSEGIKNNGFWVSNVLELSNALADYISIWLSDEQEDVLDLEQISENVKVYSKANQQEKIKEVYAKFCENRINEFKSKLKIYGE